MEPLALERLEAFIVRAKPATYAGVRAYELVYHGGMVEG